MNQLTRKIFEAELTVYFTYIGEEPADDATLAKYAAERIRVGDWEGRSESIDLESENLSHETLNSLVMGHEGREEWSVSDWIEILT